MKNFFSKILLAGWCLWSAFRLYSLARDSQWHSHLTPAQIGSILGAALIPVIGFLLVLRLCQEPAFSLSIFLALICAVALWKFYVGVILFAAYPSMDAHSIFNSFLKWWRHSTDGVVHFLKAIPPLCLLLVSIVYWPIHCLGRLDNQKNTAD